METRSLMQHTRKPNRNLKSALFSFLLGEYKWTIYGVAEMVGPVDFDKSLESSNKIWSIFNLHGMGSGFASSVVGDLEECLQRLPFQLIKLSIFIALTETELERLKHALKQLSEAENQLRLPSERSTWFTTTLLQLGSTPSADSTPSGSSRR
ncbi:hypothetical protein L6452_05862 [Arctium lappa]|uniref:Uncharacterized protein n=1 Tax=Arctium lappa TaxID=4217 RepID=A0ACB9EGZ9_ARCLA|nr:hypothetical protein L6452_05862 [Arctium lappa]